MGTHLPIDYPKLKETGFAIATGQETFVGVHPEITMTEDSVSSFVLVKINARYFNWGVVNRESIILFFPER